MTKNLITIALSGFLLSACQQGFSGIGGQPAQSTKTITAQSPEIEQVSYSMGYLIANGNRQDFDDLDLAAFEAGFREGYKADGESALTDSQMETVLMAYQERKINERVAHLEGQAATNKAQGADYLASNANQEGVQTTASGLQYKILTQGTGQRPTESDFVTVHYEGKLIDGKVFDSSIARGEPVSFPLDGVIAGWTEGLQLMQEGGKYMLYIPADLAYGDMGMPPDIEPGSTLIFEIELIKVESAAQAQANQNAQLEALLNQPAIQTMDVH